MKEKVVPFYGHGAWAFIHRTQTIFRIIIITYTFLFLSNMKFSSSPSPHPHGQIFLLLLIVFIPLIIGNLNNEKFVIDEVNPTPNLNTPMPEKENNEMTVEEKLDERSKKLRQALDTSLQKFLKGMPLEEDGKWCQGMIDGSLGWMERKRLEYWSFDAPKFSLISETNKRENETAEIMDRGCSRVRNTFSFLDQPLSEEERQFPLAYGIIAHKSPFQVFAMLSAIYQPQNAYCLVIDEKAKDEFKKEMQLLTDCFPNIFVMGSVGEIGWCKFGVTRAVFSCFRYLAEMKHDWKYFQYLSGVDLPLKTNLEMVRIFKNLNGTVNMEVNKQDSSLLHKEIKLTKPPLTIWKSSLSALISRQAANAIVKSKKVRRLMRYLQYSECSDESIWATIAGNPNQVKIPGGFDAASFFDAVSRCTKIKKVDEMKTIDDETEDNETSIDEPFRPANYYISRYQVWKHSKIDICEGKFVSSSCVFGVGDLPVLIKRPELIAHKMYLDYEPAAYFCLWKSVVERALDWREQSKFQANTYSNLPTVKAANFRYKDPFENNCIMSF